MAERDMSEGEDRQFLIPDTPVAEDTAEAAQFLLTAGPMSRET